MLFSLFDVHDWRYHYEVVVVRQGREQVLARVRSRWLAEQAMLLVPAGVDMRPLNWSSPNVRDPAIVPVLRATRL